MFLLLTGTKQKGGNIEIFSIAECEFREAAAAQIPCGMIKTDWHAKPLSSEEEVEQVQGVFHITCRPNIKRDNIPSCVAVVAAHQLIWRTHPENWAADSRSSTGQMQHNNHILHVHWTLGLKLVFTFFLRNLLPQGTVLLWGSFIPANFLEKCFAKLSVCVEGVIRQGGSQAEAEGSAGNQVSAL